MSDVPVRYRVALPHRRQHLVEVRLVVPDDLAPGARIVMPVWTPGSYVVRDYVHHVQRIGATDADGAAVALTPDGHTAWRLPTTCPGRWPSTSSSTPTSSRSGPTTSTTTTPCWWRPPRSRTSRAARTASTA